MWFTKRNADSGELLLADTSNVEELRAQRVWKLVNVAWMTWLFFTFYCWLRGYYVGAVICLVEIVTIQVMIGFHRPHGSFRRVMNLALGATAAGLLGIAYAEPELQACVLFFPASIVIASQLLGVYAAFVWSVIGVFANTIFFHVFDRTISFDGGPRLDEMIMIYGVGACLFFCCQQGEDFYRARTKGLVDLSNGLRKKASHLHLLATTDALTGLVNRFQFQIELSDRVEHAVAACERMALLLIDMDGFKEINDTLGHPVGDQALVEVATRLRNEFGMGATVARLGGDEFCLIFSDVGSDETATELAQKTAAILTERYELNEYDFPMGASVGIALSPDHTKSATDLLAYADTAMFFAKDRGLGHALYSPDMTQRLIENRSMQEKLSQALDRDEFFLLYQPQVNLDTGKIIGVEALLRWKHAGKVVGPDRFIPMLEKTREIEAVGRWTIEAACEQLRQWNNEGFDIEVSVNLSCVQFNDETLVPTVANAIQKYNLIPHRLDFEITESLLVDDVDKAIERMSEIKEIGASISIDDFGTGYSSLAYLQQFPLDRLKIDRAFVKDYPDGDDGVIAMSIVALGKAIGLKVLAEGVETEAQLKFLQSLDCDEYQGYFFSRPESADNISALLAQSMIDSPLTTPDAPSTPPAS